MSGFTRVKEGSVQIKHYSTSSQVKITITSKGQWQEDKESIWLSYSAFDDLKKAISQIDL